MEFQLRVYRIRRGAFDEFLTAWRRHIVPLRERFGFEIVDAWWASETSEFISVLRYGGEEGIEKRELEYIVARGHEVFEDDPKQYLEGHEIRVMSRL